MSIISTSLENALYAEKLQVGPTISKPGPILLKQASTAEILVVMENPSMEMSRQLTPVIITYAAR